VLIDRLPSDRLVLEIVETAILMDEDRAVAELQGLRARGIRIALDDFGTGLSNLDRLRRLPCDIVKIDRAFVAGLDQGGRSVEILRALADLAERLAIDLVAEGVETAAEAEAIRAVGIRYGQGWHFGRPAPDVPPPT
jgi:EAL domain-containing protein (putative c-di-GMP-specific phosphodiesterase class I)